MLFRMRHGRGGLTQAAANLVATIVVVAQAMALVAPLLDVHPAQHSQIIVLPAASGSSLNTPTHPVEHHNPLTCPACIAQSLVAALPDPPPHAPSAVTTTRDRLVSHEPYLLPESILHHNPRGPPLIG